MTSSDSDVVLMLRVKDGDHEAFRELIERHQRAVINVIHRAIGDAWEAEDLAQRVFIQVFRSARRYQPTAKFTTWLYTITHNAIRNEYRRILDEADIELLKRVHQQNHLEYDDRLRPLLQLLAILEYRNGENWCDIHPVLRRLIE